MTGSVPPVQARGVCKSFVAPGGGQLAAVRDVSFEVRAGGLVALVGPDGAGKTTLLRMMCGLLAPDQGELRVLGIDVARHPQQVQDRISYMPQRFGLYEDMSVQENLNLYADLHGVPQAQRQQRFTRMLEMTDMARFRDRLAGKLSGGMKQKLGLACTLVRLPDLLLLDEPTVGVDPLSRRDLWKIVQQLVIEEKLSVIVSTAYMDEAENCAQVFVMHHGSLLLQGAPTDLREAARGLTFSAEPGEGRSPRSLQADLLDAPDEIVDALPDGSAVRFIRQPEGDDRRLGDLLQGADCHPREPGFEDVFMMTLSQGREASHAMAGPTFQTLAAPAADSGRPVIAVRDLVRKFGDFTAVASTSFEVARGEIFGLLGPNGAGKTTTFRMLCGLLPATSGHLEVAGLNLRTARARARGRIGYVAQKFSLYGNLSVRENLEFFGGAYGLRGVALREAVARIIAQFELDPLAISGILPGGYKQRLAMAAGLLHQPEILFLDEPTSGIDPLARRAFWRTITALAASGVTIIVTTHFMEEAEYCDRIAIQDAGKMLALGTPQQVRRQAGTDPHLDMNRAFIAIIEQARGANATPATREAA